MASFQRLHFDFQSFSNFHLEGNFFRIHRHKRTQSRAIGADTELMWFAMSTPKPSLGGNVNYRTDIAELINYKFVINSGTFVSDEFAFMTPFVNNC